MNHHRALAYCLRMTFSENRFTLFRIMLQSLEPGHDPMQIVFIRAFDLRGDDLADLQRPAA
jgi:hypothetical protein